MKYMLLIYSAEDSWTDSEMEACMSRSMQICEGLKAQGKLLDASPLHSVSKATCLRMREGKKMVTDGPFAETHEQLGGYYLLDVADLDEALAIAGSLPPAQKGTVEIRPLFTVPDAKRAASDD